MALGDACGLAADQILQSKMQTHPAGAAAWTAPSHGWWRRSSGTDVVSGMCERGSILSRNRPPQPRVLDGKSKVEGWNLSGSDQVAPFAGVKSLSIHIVLICAGRLSVSNGRA